MRRLLPAPKVRPPPVRRQEVTTVAEAAASAQADVDAVQAAPVVTTAATSAFSGEQVITGTPDGTKFLRDDYSWQAGGSGGAPTTAQYVVLATDATLTGERVLTAGTGVTVTDGGAGGNVTISASGSSGSIGGHTGNTYGLGRGIYIPGLVTGATVSSVSHSVNTLRVIPFRCPPRSGTISSLGAIVTAATSAGNSLRVMLFRNADATYADMYPGALAAETGALATTATGYVSDSVSAAFNPGEMLWLGVVTSVGTTLRSGTVAGQDQQIMGYSIAATVPSPIYGLSVAHTYGAAPDPFPAGATSITSSPIPACLIEFSA